MKKLALIVCVVISSSLSAQVDLDSLFYDGTDTTGLAQEIANDEKGWVWTDSISSEDFVAIDGKVNAMTKKYKSVDALSKDLATMFPDEVDYVRAAFIWIAYNITYDRELANDREKLMREVPSFNNRKEEMEFWTKEYKDYAEGVLKNGKGVCEGYSILFYELCKANNVKCRVIHGKATDFNTGKLSTRGHAWNQVLINGDWVYLDSTWGKYFSLNIYPTHVVNEAKTKRRNNLVGNY